jgi:MoaA/NifB/PqqE/SkfB family radical SAM enzyme
MGQFHKIYMATRVLLKGFPAQGLGAVDVTNQCNLRCRHCYYYTDEPKDELEVNQWIEKFKDLRRTGFPFLQCTWIGGEPLLRKDLIEKCKDYFRSNTVVTNGTMELPNWPEVNFYVSVDGTEEYYEYMRKKKGIYKLIKKNVDRADLKVTIACVITKQNYPCLEEMVAEWFQTKVRGIVFDFYTPIQGIEEDLWLDWDMRDKVLDKLLGLEKKYPQFCLTPTYILQLMKSDKCQEIIQNCLYPKTAFCFDALGNNKSPCMLGPKADCSRCGCIVPFYLAALQNKKFFLSMTLKTLGEKIFHH